MRKTEAGGRWFEERQEDLQGIKCGGGGEQMSDVVGGSERKTVCVMSSHFPLHIHGFSLQKAKPKRSQGITGPLFIKHHTLSNIIHKLFC